MGEIKQAYISELEQRLNDWQIDMRKLKARMEKADVDTGHQLYVQIQALRQQRDETQEKLKELQETEHADWQHLKEWLDDAWADLSGVLQQVGKGFESEFRK